MPLYEKVATDLKFAQRELEVLDFWEKQGIVGKCMGHRKGGPCFTFYDGPPTANGMPHIGHVLTRSIKDIIPRYRAMKGYDVMRKAGWDTHGLPVELEVERQLGIDGKNQIEAYGVEPFIAECKKSVWKYKDEWERMSERVAFWADMKDPYVTYENDYIESIWWSLKKIHEQGLLYKGHKIVPYCPRCGTALSSHEVAQGYKDVVEPSIIVRFRCADEDASFLAWTTTPWTLPSNVSLCVNADVVYCRAEKGGEVFIMAKELVAGVLGEEAKILGEFKGAELEYKKYIPLWPVVNTDKPVHLVCCDPYVTLGEGTGIVHQAPAFGEDDARVCKKYDMPFVQFVDTQGRMTDGLPWNGLFVKEADGMILENLRQSGALFAVLDYEHSYPFCWRCDTPLLYYARASWFIAMTKVKDKLIDFNRRVNWLPETIKEGRMGNFIENVVDWGLSRERYWGTPLPVWTCGCGHVHVVGSREELVSLGRDVKPDIELHKPFIDEIRLACPKCGKDMAREKDVIDCWYDSGSMPFAQWHYPFENKELFETRYPADFISEAIDQTRGWFYTLLAISTLLFDEPSFKSCIVLGHVQDKDGRKMSKHLGNVIDPKDILAKQGADAVRWYFFTGSSPWLPSRFGEDPVSESQRKFMGTLWNTYAFYILYANIDGFDPTKHELIRQDLTEMDRWILSRLNSLIGYVEAQLDKMHITEAGRELSRFVEELSNWYVRRCRERFWGSEMTKDKTAAYMTLYTVLDATAKVAAPFVPFMTEHMYQNMVRSVNKAAPESIHLSDFPLADASLIDQELEASMAKVLDIVALGRACRNAGQLKNRQPLTELIAICDPLPGGYASIIAEELNVKRVSFAGDSSAFTTYNVKPQLKTMGPKYGRLLGQISERLKAADGNEIVACFKAGRPYEFTVGDTQIAMEEADALTELTHKAGYIAQAERDLTVVIDANLTEELVEEGFVRELISKIQNMRKDAGFEVTDRIEILHEGNARIAGIFEKFGGEICAETLSVAVLGGSGGSTKQWDVNGEAVTLSVRRV